MSDYTILNTCAKLIDMKKGKPKISIVIATLNSERTLEKCLASIKKQKLPKNQFEVIIGDGGSTDKTLEIAKKYKCKVFNNEKVLPSNAKYIGFLKAKGQYVMFLDSDEVLKNRDSLNKRIEAFETDDRIKILHGSGYLTPRNINPINQYINEFGDPFSFFIYRLSKDYRFFVKNLRSRYEVVLVSKSYLLFKYDNKKRMPLMELTAAGGTVDKKYCLKNFKKLSKSREKFLPFLNLHILRKNPYVAIVKNDPIYHYSADNFMKYMKKLNWRVQNNIYFVKAKTSSRFVTREQFEGNIDRLYKYLFIPYAFSLIFPFYDAFRLSYSRKNITMFFHILLTLVTALLIIYHYFCKFMGLVPKVKSSDGEREVDKK